MRIASYSRVSTSHHDQKPEIQVNEIQRFCKSRGWNICHELVDHGFSGSTDNRPGLRSLMALVRSKEIDAVVVVKMDRLFRSLKHLVTTLEEFEKIGVLFVAIKDNVDYSTPTGRLFVQILGSLGEFERSLLRERTLMGLDHARANGKKFGRPRIHDHSKIVELHRTGMTYRQIQSVLGVPMGTIAGAIKAARKSPLLTQPDTGAHNTVVFGASVNPQNSSPSVNQTGGSVKGR